MDNSNLNNLGELELLTALIVGEADAEPLIGKFAVAWVVKNRVNDRRWPAEWKDVMLQDQQFSCFLPKYLRPAILKPDWGSMYWRECRLAAMGVYFGYTRDLTYGATHYHARWMNPFPAWSNDDAITLSVGEHIFYKL